MLCNFSSDTRGNQPLDLSSLSRTHLNIIHLHPHRVRFFFFFVWHRGRAFLYRANSCSRSRWHVRVDVVWAAAFRIFFSSFSENKICGRETMIEILYKKRRRDQWRSYKPTQKSFNFIRKKNTRLKPWWVGVEIWMFLIGAIALGLCFVWDLKYYYHSSE